VVKTIVTLACIGALAIAVAPAGASPVGGMAKPGSADASAPTATVTPAVVPELRTVVIHERDAGRTLALVLAASALGVTFLSIGYMTLRLRGTRPQA
jgi:hypothetical protein